MPLALPAYDGTDDTLQFILDLIANSAIDTGGRSIKLRFGRSTSTFPGGANGSTAKVVDHGLGSTPISVLATFDGTGPWVTPLTMTLTSTQFTWQVRTVDGSSPAAATATAVYWLAVG